MRIRNIWYLYKKYEKKKNEMNKNIYVVQFGTGTTINLLPLAAGQLVARLKQENEFMAEYNLNLCEIIFSRPENPEEIVSKMESAFIVGFSCFLWNMNISLQTAKEVRRRFPDALIVTGGPSIPKDPELTEGFFEQHPEIDVICIGEGEEVFASICRHYSRGEAFSDIPGIIYRDRTTGKFYRTAPEEIVPMDRLLSPYLEGTFDDFYQKHQNEFSGIIWETNRGCPYECAFCTWGNLPSRKIREKPMEQVKGEIEWFGRNKVKYIAMSDSNFGIRERDIELAEMLAECKRKYGVPNFISVSWAKNSPHKILKIADILKKSGIGFRVTLSLQSLNEDVIKAINRTNIKKNSFDIIKANYRSQRLYSYTELILGLPMETYDSFISGIENSLSESVFEQLYIYPLFLFPNTKITSSESRKKYGLEGKIIENRYTKSKKSIQVKEFVEIVVGTSAMPKNKWIDSFVICYYTLALHDDRLAFFIFHYLKKTFLIKITDIIAHASKISSEKEFPILKKAFLKLKNTAIGVQELGNSHLIEPESFHGIPYDPPEGIFLELLMDRELFYSEFLRVVELYLEEKLIKFDRTILKDLFLFQKAAIAHPNGPDSELLHLNYNWVEYFAFAFNLKGAELYKKRHRYKVVDPKPSYGDTSQYLKNSFDVRGVPAFNRIYDESNNLIFPM